MATSYIRKIDLQERNEEHQMQTKDHKRRVALLVDNSFEESELFVPLDALNLAEAETVILGSRRHVKYEGMLGRVSITTHATTTEAFPDMFDAIVIPGGMAPDAIRTDMKTVRFIQRAAQLAKLIVAIGHGPQVLIEADLLRGKRATGIRSIRKDMQNAGANYVNEPLVVDGYLLTARRPGDLPMLTTALLHRLGLTIKDTPLPDEHDPQAPWWELAAQWGGSSQGEIMAALQETLQGEQYALSMCERHLQKTADEELHTLFQQLCTSTQHHCERLSGRLKGLGASAAAPAATNGATAAQEDWLQLHDITLVLLRVLDHLQARIVTAYRFCNTLTDPVTVDILAEIEVSLAKSEQQVADIYHHKVLAHKVAS
jgi:protease I